MPANTTKFECFREEFCKNCIHDVNEDCPLIQKAVENIDKPKCGPKQWQRRQADNMPYCTKFKKSKVETKKENE